MTLRMLAPQRRELFGASWAWSPGTNGPLAGDVVYMDARTQSDFDRRFAGKLRGAWVMVGPAYAVFNPDGPRTAADSARVDSIRARRRCAHAGRAAFHAGPRPGARAARALPASFATAPRSSGCSR